MDRTDYMILNHLQEDCTATLRKIGESVGLTPPAVAERIRKLEDEGVIRSYRIHMDRTKLGLGIIGFIMVATEPEKYEAFCKFCKNSPEITEHVHVIGNYNAILRFAVRDTNELDELLGKIKMYGDSRTSVELKTYFDMKKLIVP